MAPATLLISAHLLGELARRCGQPMVIGEILGGILLGPTCLGWIAPATQVWLFPHEGPASIALDAVVALAVTLLLLLAGMEVDLSSVFRQGRPAAWIAAGSLLVPLVAGAGVAWFAPEWWGMPEGGSRVAFAAFFGAALAVSALPVIAKILMELDLFQSDFGVMVLVVATVNNLVAWLIFSVITSGNTDVWPLVVTVLATLGFATVMLTIGRYVADISLIWTQAHLSWPAGVLGLAVVSGLLGAAATQSIGIHAIFGAFLAGVALGESPHMREQTRHIVHRFVEGVMAPIFVAAIGLEVNFAANFRPMLVLRVVLMGTAVKVLGSWVGARWAGRKGIEAWGAGWALNARGELGIVLGLLAWQAGIIRERLFVALVTLAIISSALAGPILKRLLQRDRPRTLASLLDTGVCQTDCNARTSEELIRELSTIAAKRAKLDAEQVAAAVLRREAMMGTGLGHGVAVPHARFAGLSEPVVVAGVNRMGVAFDGLDEEPVRLVFLILTPEKDAASQLQILSSIGALMHDPHLREEAMSARTPTALLGALRVSGIIARQTVKSA